LKTVYNLFFVLFLFFVGSSNAFSQVPISVGNQLNTFTSMIRGYHFTAPTNFTICGLQVPNNASNGLQTIRVVRFTAAAPPAFPGNTNAFVQLFTVTNAANGIVPCNIPVTAGQIIGVYGVRGACVNSYGPPNFVTSILGFNTTLQRSGMQSCPTPGGAPMTNIWSEVFYNIGRITMYINCCAPPTGVATNSGPVCVGNPLLLTASPTPAIPLNGVYTYAWTGPNGFTSNLQNPTIQNPTPAESGTYTCTINSPCGSVQVTTQVVINPSPTATITNNTGGNIIDCNTPVINVTAGGGTTYAWDNGLGTNNTASISNAGLYTVTVTNAQGCTDTASIAVSVAPTPTVSFNGATICEGQSTTLNAAVSPAGGTIAWNSGQTATTITVNPIQTTTYTATYTWNGCSAVDSATVIVNLQPSVSVNSDTICNGDTTTLVATPDLLGGTYQWSNGQTLQSINVNPGLPGTTYSVVYTLTGCTAQASGTVTVNPVPVITIAPVIICFGETAALTAVPNLPGGAFLWSPAGQTTNSINVTPSVTTNYSATYSLLGCISPVASGQVTVKPLPLMNFTADTTYGCIPLNVTFTPTVSNPLTTYQWSSTNGYSGAGSQVQVLYTVGGCYDMSVVGTLNGCVDSSTMIDYICVENYPTAEFDASTLLFTETSQTVNFENSSLGATTYLWDFGDGEFSTEFSPAHLFMGTGSGFEITLIASTSMGCIDSTSLSIAPQQGGIYYIPNSFTPDGDMYNQVFKPVFTAGYDIYQYNMLIFNRWGEVVFETNNLDFGWDGSYGLGGADALPGSYTYTINIKVPENDDRVIITGHVNLIR
jgi:gliding motility-associated-like protein